MTQTGTWYVAPDERVVARVPHASASQAMWALQRRGLRPRAGGQSHLPTRGHPMHDRVLIIVHEAHEAEARAILEGWERESQEAIGRHMRRLPLDVLRILLFVGLVIGAVWLLMLWSAERASPGMAAAAVGLVVLGLIGEVMRRRRR